MFLPKRTVVLLALLMAAASACSPKNDEGKSEAYIENGVLWAYGTIQLASLDVPGVIMLKRESADQTLDTKYALYGASKAAASAAVSGEHDLAYGDLHPSRDRMLAYSYTLDAQPRLGVADVVDVWAILKHGGRSYQNLQRVYLGTAQFTPNQLLAEMALAEGLKLSLIDDGAFSGAWALHYPDAPQYVQTPWQGLCARNVAQLPGQNPNQTVGQAHGCKPLPAQQDLCEGDPTKDGCRPPAPVQAPTQQATAQDVATGLEVISATDGVYALPKETAEAKLTFVSQTIAAASDAANAQLCAQTFLAVGRTLGREVNGACVLKPAPAAPVGGKLTCAVTVAFNDPQTYMERVCDVTGAFRGAADDQTTVQVLKR